MRLTPGALTKLFALTLLVAIVGSGSIHAQDSETPDAAIPEPEEAAAAVEQDPEAIGPETKVPIAEFKLLLQPRRKAEIAELLKAWMDTLVQRSDAVVASKLELLRTEGEEAKAAAQARTDALISERDQFVVYLRALLTEGVKKGVDVEQDERYLSQVVETTAKVEQAPTNRAQAKDVNDPEIPVRELRLRLLPMTADDIDRVAKTWLGHLKNKAAEISVAEINKLKAETDEAQDEAIKQATKLREERAAISERFEAVLSALDAKGGDAKTYRSYIKQVSDSGLDTEDIFDVNALWTWSLSWIESREGGIKWGLNIVKFIAVIVIFKLLGNVLGRLMQTAVNRLKGASTLLRNFLVNAVKKTATFVGLIIALGMLGIPIAPFVAVIGAAGLVIGLALQGTLSNFAAGMLILIYRPYDVGDFIKIGSSAGKVNAMNMFSTIIMTPDNQIVMIPNGTIWGGTITNVTGSPTRRIDLVFGIHYDDDIDEARKILLSVIESHELVLDDPVPVVRVNELAESSVNLVARPWVRTNDYWQVYWDITAEVKRRFDAAEITIPFPQRDLHVYQSLPATTEASASKS